MVTQYTLRKAANTLTGRPEIVFAKSTLYDQIALETLSLEQMTTVEAVELERLPES
jgi:hypothetical protein